MVVQVKPGLLEHMYLHDGARFIAESSDVDLATAAMDEARQRVGRIVHPEEDAPAFSCSEVECGPTGPQFTARMTDADAYPGMLERALEAVMSAFLDKGPDDVVLSWPPAGLDERIGEAVATGLVPRELCAELNARIANGQEPGEIVAWLASESERRDLAAYDAPLQPAMTDDDHGWVSARALTLALQGIISSSRHAGLADIEVLSTVENFLEAQGRALDARLRAER